MAFVVDASVTMAWHFADEVTDLSRSLAARADIEPIVVPIQWFGEVTNALIVGERRGRADVARSARFVAFLGELQVEVDDSDQIFERVLPLARAHGLTAYDAIYLELAERRGLPLATFDGELADAARVAGVEVLGGRR